MSFISSEQAVNFLYFCILREKRCVSANLRELIAAIVNKMEINKSFFKPRLGSSEASLPQDQFLSAAGPLSQHAK
jgi:hypothetical protein